MTIIPNSIAVFIAFLILYIFILHKFELKINVREKYFILFFYNIKVAVELNFIPFNHLTFRYFFKSSLESTTISKD